MAVKLLIIVQQENPLLQNAEEEKQYVMFEKAFNHRPNIMQFFL
jgi:hypothetical protein